MRDKVETLIVHLYFARELIRIGHVVMGTIKVSRRLQ